ncbi:MAG: SGNH/GDSL hydrolase family protein [Acidimicrobiales bacterium]|jgi:lysophospholipase L1-like esterase
MGIAGRVGAVAVAGLALLLTSCSSVNPGSSNPPSTGSATPIPAGARYVAIGSSYAAGIGIPAAAGGPCARSTHNYPSLVAAALDLTLDDVSCSGATTVNVLTTGQYGDPPQIDAVTPNTALVTFTVGGNDIGYVATAFACGAPSPACTVDRSQLSAALVALRTSLTTVVNTIHLRAPSAKVVLVTYPRLVPPTACPALDYTAAGSRIVASMGQDLEQVFLEVAHDTHVILADPYAIGAGHGPCTPPAQRWVAGHTVTVGFPYHPTPAGHVEMASLVEEALHQT